jgi:diguanylate cyclase (GGDEF)-like protein/PAS domain S-box-containing protein
MLDDSPVPLASHDYAEQLFDLAEVIMLVLDVRGRVERINPKGCEILGRRVEDILGKDWFDHFLPEDIRQETRRVFHRLVNGEEELVRHRDNSVLTASGEIRCIEWHNALLRDTRNQITGILSSGLDVTESRRKTDILRTYERIVSNVPDNIAIVGRDYVYRLVNEAYSQFHGRTREQCEDHSIAELFGSELFESTIKPRLDRCFAGEVVNYEDCFDIPGTGRRYRDVVYIPYIEADGTVVGAIARARDVTDLHLAHDDLRDSQERYRSLFENMLHGYAYCRMLFEDGAPRDFVYLDVNPAFEVLTGLKDVVGKRVSEVIPGIREGSPELFEIYGRVTLTGRPERFESYVESLGIWFSISVYSPAQEHFVAVFDNITEHKKAETALRDNEARYRALFHANSDAIYLYGFLPSGEPDRFTEVNEAACQRLGYTEAELLTLSPQDINACGMDEKREAALRSLMAEGQVMFEMEHVAKDGRTIPMEISARLIELQGRAMVLSVARDNTERKQSLQTLKAHQEHSQMLLDSMAEGMYEVDTRGFCTFVNQSFLKMLGYERAEDLLGRHIHDLIHHSHADGSPYPSEECHAYRSFVESRDCHVDDEVFWRRDGTAFPVEYWSYPLRRNGETVGSVVTFQDISERLQTAEKLQSARQMLQHIIDTVPNFVFWKDRDSRYLGCNEAFARLAGLQRPEEIIGKDDHELLWHEFADLYQRDDAQVISSGMPMYNIIEPLSINCGITLWLETNKVPLRNTQGQVIGVLGVFQDITERVLAEEKLRQAAKVFESTMEGVVITNPEGAILAVNPAFTDITGYTEAEILGKDLRIRQSGRHDKSFYQAMWASILQTGSWRGEIWNRRKTGETYPEWLTINTVKDEAGNTVNYVGVFTDISQMKRSEAELDYLAHHDPLTELPNRLLLNARLEYAIQRAQREGTSLTVLFIDLDRFKTVNDSLGHPVGDQLLKLVAALLTACVRSEDTVARLGGDEFVVVLEGVGDTGDASAMAEKILNTLSKRYDLNGQTVFIGASIGISTYPKDGRDGTTLLKNADAAMYRSKEEGRNTFRFYNAEFTRTVHARLTLETELRRAIENQEFFLNFQPQVNASSGAIVGVEALVRWQHPQSGIISPLRFIPLAEETGLILPLGDWVLNAACEQIQAWLESDLPPITLAVNLSPRQFQHRDLVKQVRAVLDATGLPPQLLELEITEGAIMDRGDSAVTILRTLKDLGVKLAIDDFGTGYSSLAYLRRFPIDTLKIDQSFMRDIPHDTGAMEIAATIISMARNLRMQALAEGVETLKQLAFLQYHGCDTYQGFLNSRPITAESFAAMLRSSLENQENLLFATLGKSALHFEPS